MDRPKAGGSVETVVTYLEMPQPAARPESPLALPGVTILPRPQPSVEAYRALYDRAGRDWTWTARALMSDATLGAILEDARVEVFVIQVGGRDAGYVELDGRTPPELELAYLGIFPEFLGRGLGRHLLAWAIAYAWRERSPARLWVHTCTLDHPAALPLYQKLGFTPYAERNESVDLIAP